MTDVKLCEECGRRPSERYARNDYAYEHVHCEDGRLHDLADAAPELLELLREWAADEPSLAWEKRVDAILARFEALR